MSREEQVHQGQGCGYSNTTRSPCWPGWDWSRRLRACSQLLRHHTLLSQQKQCENESKYFSAFLQLPVSPDSLGLATRLRAESPAFGQVCRAAAVQRSQEQPGFFSASAVKSSTGILRYQPGPSDPTGSTLGGGGQATSPFWKDCSGGA